MIDIMDSFIIIIIIILISFGFYSFILTLGTLDLIAVLSVELLKQEYYQLSNRLVYEIVSCPCNIHQSNMDLSLLYYNYKVV